MRYVAVAQLVHATPNDGQKPPVQTSRKYVCKDPQEHAQEELRRKKSEEAFRIWKENKAKEEKEKRQALKLLEEKKRAEENERLAEIRKLARANRENWLRRKIVQNQVERKKKENELDKAKEKHNEKKMLSREVVATWMQISRNRPKPVSSNVFGKVSRTNRPIDH